MATTSSLDHGLGMRGYKHQCTEYKQGEIHHHVRRQRSKRRCRHCGARGYKLRLTRPYERRFHASPVGRHRQMVILHGYRQQCRHCGRCAREPVPFAPGQARYTRTFAHFVLSLCLITTVKAIAGWLGVGWDLIKAIHKDALHSCLRRRRLGEIRRIAVDEFALRRGHSYMTVVLDLDSGQVLHVQQGKDTAALRGFLKRLRKARAPLQAVAMDLSAAYQKAVRDVYGFDVDIVHDPYHIVALVNDAIDETRRRLVRVLQGESAQAVKGMRFVLLRGFERLNRTDSEQLRRLVEVNESLLEAYLLKEQMRQFWSISSPEDGRYYLDAWIRLARTSASQPFQRLAATFERHRRGLLAFFKHRITSGPLEGLNNRIKTLKRQAYGFRDMEYFRLLVLNLHEPLVQNSG